MGFLSIVFAFFLHLKEVLEAAMIIFFGYVVPIIETLAVIKLQRLNEGLPQTKLKKLLGMWAGIILLEAILVPVS